MKQPPRVRVRLFHELRSIIGQSELEIEASTINDVFDSLIRKEQGLKAILYDSNGHLRGYTLIYVNNKVLNPPDLFRKLNDGDLILLIPPAAGG